MALQAQFLLVIFQIFKIFISSKMRVAISPSDPKCRIGKQLQTVLVPASSHKFND